MIIYRSTDKIPVKIGDYTFWLSPLTHQAKQELYEQYETKAGEVVVNRNKVAFLSIKHSLKRIEGLDAEFSDGVKFELAFEDSGSLTDESVETVMNLDFITSTRLRVASQLVLENRMQEKFEGIDFDFSKVESAKKN